MSEPALRPRETFNDFVQIGVVVKDLDRTVKALTEIFGLGPFRTITWPPADRADIERYYHGQPGNFSARMAFASLGPVELEIIQPLEGDNIWTDFLAEHGEGLHHIRFNVLDLDRVIAYLADHDIPIAQWGSGLRPGTAWMYFDTQEKVGLNIEVLKKVSGTDGRTPNFVDEKARTQG